MRVYGERWHFNHSSTFTTSHTRSCIENRIATYVRLCQSNTLSNEVKKKETTDIVNVALDSIISV